MSATTQFTETVQSDGSRQTAGRNRQLNGPESTVSKNDKVHRQTVSSRGSQTATQKSKTICTVSPLGSLLSKYFCSGGPRMGRTAERELNRTITYLRVWRAGVYCQTQTPPQTEFIPQNSHEKQAHNYSTQQLRYVLLTVTATPS